MKHGYATRSNLTDPQFYPQVVDKLVRDCLNETLHEEIRKNITYETHNISYYNPGYAAKEAVLTDFLKGHFWTKVC